MKTLWCVFFVCCWSAYNDNYNIDVWDLHECVGLCLCVHVVVWSVNTKPNYRDLFILTCVFSCLSLGQYEFMNSSCSYKKQKEQRNNTSSADAQQLRQRALSRHSAGPPVTIETTYKHCLKATFDGSNTKNRVIYRTISTQESILQPEWLMWEHIAQTWELVTGMRTCAYRRFVTIKALS